MGGEPEDVEEELEEERSERNVLEVEKMKERNCRKNGRKTNTSHTKTGDLSEKE